MKDLRNFYFKVYTNSENGSKFTATLPTYYDLEVLHRICRNVIFSDKYRIQICYRPSSIDEYESVMLYNIDEVVEHVKSIRLYKTRKVEHRVTDTVVATVIRFKLSNCFMISDVQFTHSYGYCFGMTFFKVNNVVHDVDLVFKDNYLRGTLGCKLASSGSYFLHGQWKFFRCTQKPTEWLAKKIETVSRVVGVDYKTELIK